MGRGARDIHEGEERRGGTDGWTDGQTDEQTNFKLDGD